MWIIGSIVVLILATVLYRIVSNRNYRAKATVALRLLRDETKWGKGKEIYDPVWAYGDVIYNLNRSGFPRDGSEFGEPNTRIKPEKIGSTGAELLRLRRKARIFSFKQEVEVLREQGIDSVDAMDWFTERLALSELTLADLGLTEDDWQELDRKNSVAFAKYHLARYDATKDNLHFFLARKTLMERRLTFKDIGTTKEDMLRRMIESL